MVLLHAPAAGGATALIACSMPHMAAWHGFQLVVAVTVGSVIMLLLALLLNNACKDREYPTYWW
jgi:CBS-domain-containing membrane protein